MIVFASCTQGISNMLDWSCSLQLPPSTLSSFSSTFLFQLLIPLLELCHSTAQVFRICIGFRRFTLKFPYDFIGRAHLHVRRVSGSITTRYRVWAKSQTTVSLVCSKATHRASFTTASKPSATSTTPVESYSFLLASILIFLQVSRFLESWLFIVCESKFAKSESTEGYTT